MSLIPKRRQGGFTMLDSTLAMLVLSMGLLTSMMVMQNANSTTLQSDFRVVAGALAEQKIESILADKAFQGYGTVDDAAYPEEQMSGTYEGYTRSVNIEEVSSDDLSSHESGSGLKKVTVTVSWGEETGQSVSLSMVVGNYSS